jgi:poly(A) polymerase
MSADDRVELPRDRPVGQLPPQDWMTEEATLRVVAALTATGTEIRFVGGCVRDSLAARPVSEIDIATPDQPETVIELLDKAGLQAIPTGIEHGTVTTFAGERRYEITSLRLDVETFGRRARVTFTDDWEADAQRRDFTINALYCRPDGAIIDPCEGLADLGARRVRFVGEPMRRIEEDALRILRFFRFYALFGSPPPNREALLACRAGAPRLKDLSGERIYAEFMKILAAPDPANVLLWMQAERVLDEILPEAQDFGRLRLLTFVETRGILRPDVAPDMLRRFAALLPNGEAAVNIAARLRLSNSDTARLVALSSVEPAPFVTMGLPSARRMIHGIGAEVFRDRVLLAWAGVLAKEGRHGAGPSEDWNALLDVAKDWRPMRLPISGDDVIAIGVPPGPKLGKLLARLEDWWVEGDFKADREQILQLLRTMIETDRQ